MDDKIHFIRLGRMNDISGNFFMATEKYSYTISEVILIKLFKTAKEKIHVSNILCVNEEPLSILL